MNLRVLLPHRVFAERSGVRRVVAETREGAFGILPRRLDCVAALVPGILLYEDDTGAERYIAVDEGVLVKAGADLVVSVRNAIAGDDLAGLRGAVEREFVDLDESERSVRSLLARMEGSFIRRLTDFRDG